jgi:HSP20 family protein
MSTLTRWDPFKELDELHTRLSRALGGRATRTTGNGKEQITVAEWEPLVDISEDDNAYLIKAELPEINRDDVKVRLENGVLTISGDRRWEKEEGNRKYHRVERAYGSFVRSFTMPDDADPDKVRAEFKDGILRVSISKSEKARARAIEVKVG